MGGFWDQVGRQIEAKLAPKSEKMRYQDDIKKTSKIKRPEQVRVNPREGGGSLKTIQNQTIRTPVVELRHTLRAPPQAPGPGGGYL